MAKADIFVFITISLIFLQKLEDVIGQVKTFPDSHGYGDYILVLMSKGN